MDVLDHNSSQEAHNPADNQRAMWPHLIGLSMMFSGLLGFIGVIVYYFMNKDKSPFVRHHCAQALNFQITYFALHFLLIIAAAVVVLLSISNIPAETLIPDKEIPNFLFGIVALVFFMVFTGLVNLIMCIIGAVKSTNGEYWNNPLSIPFIKE